MVKVTILYNQPKDPEAFEKYYLETHVPEHGMKLPGCIRLEANKAVAAPDPPPYYRTADLYYNDMAAMQASLSSTIGQAAVADLDNFATGGYKVLVTESQTVKMPAAAHAS